MKTSANPGTIFISHSSRDKPLIESILGSIPQSHVFYDVRTLAPGEYTIDALQDAILDASVFCLFVSPNTPESCWVNYETALARAQKIARSQLRILVCPINGATYRDAPRWMQDYTVVPSNYTICDIARSLKYEYEEALKARGLLKQPIFVGRESLVNKMVVESRTRPSATGVPVNFVVLAGIENMGRTSVAREVIPKMFPGGSTSRPGFRSPGFCRCDRSFYLTAARHRGTDR